MDLATIQIKIDSRQVLAANDDLIQLGKTGKETGEKVDSANDQMSKSATSTTSAFKLLGGAMAALGVGALVSAFSETVTESERLKASLKTMTGSTEDAAFAFSELEKFAAQTPFTLDQSVQGFIKLKALGLDPSERALKSYGNTAAAMGKDMMQMIEAVADASTGEFERLKEFGIKASKEGDRVSLTFQGMTTTIGNSSQEIQEYLLNIGETKFGSAMADQMKSLPGLLSNLQDNVSGLFRKIGDVGGINLFAGAVTAASAVILAITNNLEAVTIGVGAALAGFIAFTIGSNATAMLGGFSMIRTAVLALNTAIMANPIGLIAAAIGVASVVIISYWDEIKVGAEKAVINIQILFEELKIFLTASFAASLNSIINMFSSLQNQAIATMSALAEAVKYPLDAINVFNSTFNTTLANLESGQNKTTVFAGSIKNSQDRVNELNEKLAVMNSEVALSNPILEETGQSLSDYAIQIDESVLAASSLALETEAANTKALELLGTLSNEFEALHMSNLEIAIRNNLQKAGVEATSELGQQIILATTELHNEKEAILRAAEATKQLELDSNAAQKAIEQEAKRVAEEAEKAYARMKANISGFFVDLFNNGKNAFDNLAKTFKNMIITMLADWAAGKVADIITASFSGAGNSISGIFSGIFSSIGSGLSSLASSAVSLLTRTVTGAAAASVTGTAATAGVTGTAASAATTAGVTAAGTGVLGQLIGGMTGTAVGTSATLVGPPTAAAAAGSGIASTIGGIASTVGSAVSSVGSALMTGLKAIPGWGWALAGAALAAKLLDSSGTMSSNAGMFTQNLGHAGSFSIPPFASGAQFTGFSRRSSPDEATSAISAFRSIDEYLTKSYESITGNKPNLNASDFIGYNEKGLGTGAFFGIASEEDGRNGASLEDQMSKFASRWITLAGAQGGASDLEIASIIGEGTSAGILQRAGAAAERNLGIDGVLHGGLNRVPFDGYIAELHAGERVQTEKEAMASDSMVDEIGGLRKSIEEIMLAVAKNTHKLYRINDSWDKNGLPPTRV